MSKSVSLDQSRPAKNPVADALQQVLKDTYAAYLLTHNYHWNVEGPQFVSLHTLFEQQYTELFNAVDTIAERIRALGAYALKGGYGEILGRLDGLTRQDAKNKNDATRRMLEQLAALNGQAIAAAQSAKRKAEAAGDDESVDLTVERIQAHQKAVWMLKSCLA